MASHQGTFLLVQSLYKLPFGLFWYPLLCKHPVNFLDLISLDFWTCTSFLCTQCQRDWGHSHRHRWGLEEGDRKQLLYSLLPITESHLLLQSSRMPSSPEPSSLPACVLAHALALHSLAERPYGRGVPTPTPSFLPGGTQGRKEESWKPIHKAIPNPKIIFQIFQELDTSDSEF